jgi:hypothetical protein
LKGQRVQLLLGERIDTCQRQRYDQPILIEVPLPVAAQRASRLVQTLVLGRGHPIERARGQRPVELRIRVRTGAQPFWRQWRGQL